jgi:hypothetical protein
MPHILKLIMNTKMNLQIDAKTYFYFVLIYLFVFIRWIEQEAVGK